MTTVVNSVRLATDELVRCIESCATVSSPGGRVARVERRPLDTATSTAIEAVDATLADGTQLELVVKDLTRGGRIGGADAVKPSFLYDPEREIEVYADLLRPIDLGTARLFGAVVDPVRETFVVVLERVRATELHEVGDLDLWCEAARWLARLHAAFEVPAEPNRTHLLHYDHRYLVRWPERARRVMEDEGRPASDLRRLARAARVFEASVEELTSTPVTLVHGDFNAANVLVADTGDLRRVCPVDWEMAGLGAPLLDLGALTSGDWSDDARSEMTRAYLAECTPARTQPSALAETLEVLDHCHLALALQWLGWAPRWRPPSRQASDWLQVATDAAERIGT